MAAQRHAEKVNMPPNSSVQEPIAQGEMEQRRLEQSGVRRQGVSDRLLELCPWAILLLAAGLRFYHLGYKGLWGDEIWQATWSQQTFQQLWDSFRQPDDYLLHFVLVHLSEQVSTSEFWIRLPSALLSVLAVPVMYRLGRLAFDRTTALVAILIMAVAPFQVWYAQEARQGAAISFYAVLSLFFFLQLWRSPSRSTALGLTLANALGAYNHLFGFAPLLIEAVGAVGLVLAQTARTLSVHSPNRPRLSLSNLIAQSARRRIRLLLASDLAALMLVIPLIPGTFQYVMYQTQDVVDLESTLLGRFDPSLLFFLRLGNFFGLGPDWGWRTALSIGLAACGWALLVVRRINLAWITGVWLVFPFLILSLVRPHHNLSPRHLLFLQPVFLLLISVGLVTLTRGMILVLKRLPRPTKLGVCFLSSQLFQLAGISAFVLIAAQAPLASLYVRAKVNDWRALGSYLSAHAEPGDLLVSDKDLWASSAVAWYLPSELGLNSPSLTVEQLDQILASNRQIWYISLDATLNPDVEEWARRHLERIDAGAWQQPDLVYVAQPNDGFEFPMSEYPATLYRHAAPLPARIDYNDIANPKWTQVPLVPVRPRKTLVAKLALAPLQPRLLSLKFFDVKNLDFNIFLDGILFKKVIGGKNGKGWQTVIWRLPERKGDAIVVKIENVSERTTLPVSMIGLEYVGDNHGAQAPLLAR